MSSFTVCDDGHDEIIYLDRRDYSGRLKPCPVCEVLKSLADMEDERNNWKLKYEDHECEKANDH